MDAKAIINRLTTPYHYCLSHIKGNILGLCSFLFSFVVMITFIDATLSRNAAIRNIKSEIAQLISDLNEVDLDIAYNKISFNNIFIYPLIEIENLQLYNLKGQNLWQIKIPEINGRPGLFNIKKLKLRAGNQVEIKLNENTYNLQLGSAKSLIELQANGSLKELQTYLQDINIKDIAKIKDITFISRKLNHTNAARILTPTLESHFDARQITFNGLINYPLASEIQRIYAKFNLMGSLDNGETLLLAAENWLHSGGFIEIPSVMINWQPLLLVGHGDMTFDEKFSPKLQLQTSSKAMINLLEDMQAKSYLERKGVFVANILLGAKAFKLHDDDKYLTVATPVTYRDNKLAIENITIKNLMPQKSQ